MSKNTLKFGYIEFDKKEFHTPKKPIALNLVNTNKIAVSKIFEHSNKGFKYFFDYKDDHIIKPLCITLPHMIGYIKYFGNGGKKMSFIFEDNSVLVKYNEIWIKIKKILSIEFHRKFVYGEKYIKS